MDQTLQQPEAQQLLLSHYLPLQGLLGKEVLQGQEARQGKQRRQQQV